ATRLRPLVAEHRPGVPEALGLVVQQTVLLGGAHAAGGPFRAQRQAVAIAVVEAVHLFFDDVGDLADTALEQLGTLDDRETDFLVAIAPQHRAHTGLQHLPQRRLPGEDIGHPANRGDLLAHRFSLQKRRTPDVGYPTRRRLCRLFASDSGRRTSDRLF